MDSSHNPASIKKALEDVKQEMLQLQSEVQRLGHELTTIHEAISSSKNTDDLRKRIHGSS